MTYSYQRACVRFPTESSAEISTEKARGISMILTNVSAGGAGLVTNIPLDAMEKVEILIKSCLLFKDSLKKKAKVAWCKKLNYNLWQVGLDFSVDNLINFS